MMKRILHYFALAASVAVMVCSCYESTPETPVVPPAPTFTDEEGKFVRVIESDPAGKATLMTMLPARARRFCASRNWPLTRVLLQRVMTGIG